MTWVGLDLHKRYITACALDEGSAVVAEHRRLPTAAEALVAWLHDRLSAAGIAAVAAHPYQVKLIWQAPCKTDPIDARKLADLGRTNLLPAIWVATPAVRAQRTLLRGRAYLVRMRTSVKNRIHGLLLAENQWVDVSDLYGRAGRAWLQTVPLSPMARVQVDLLLDLVDGLDQRVARLDQRVQRAMKGDPVVQLLQTWPGIGIFGAALLRAEIGAIARFASGHELAAYGGLIPSTQSSGGKTTHGGVGRAGDTIRSCCAPRARRRPRWRRHASCAAISTGV